MFNTRSKSRRPLQRASALSRGTALSAGVNNRYAHPFSRRDENTRLFSYERRIKQSFARIEPVLRKISSLQHEEGFELRAQQIANAELGFDLPKTMLEDTWIKPLDIGRLYIWCVFETFKKMSDEFFTDRPLSDGDEKEFQKFLESCGFHTMDISPCADGRLAHVIRYVLRLPYKAVRRKSYAGAMFDVDDSIQKWVETEMLRYREARPNSSDAQTRYLKIAVYHHSSKLPDTEGCAAHGSDTVRAAEGALERLKAFQQAVESNFCCGASIDLLLLGIDTDNDTIRLHLPDALGEHDVHRFIDAQSLYDATYGLMGSADSEAAVARFISDASSASGASLPNEGMIRLAARLLSANLAQIDYVRSNYDGCYADLGHQERFIGMGIGFEEIQLRNLTYFAYLQTVEEGAKDLDVGIKIFSGLNVSRGLPIPVVIRYDYHGQVPGARSRAVARCKQLDKALRQRFSHLVEQGFLHTLLMVRDCQLDVQAEMVGCSLDIARQEAH